MAAVQVKAVRFGILGLREFRACGLSGVSHGRERCVLGFTTVGSLG